MPPGSDRLKPEEGAADGAEGHVRAAWRSWLSALAADPEAALAAALAYESLQQEARDAWLDALEADAPALQVPALALYAPLLAAEAEPGPRRARIEAALAGARLPARSPSQPVAFRAVAPDGTHACAIALPLYLDFVQILRCRYTPAGGFVSAQLEPMRHVDDVPAAAFDGALALEATPLPVVVEELAHAILADKRQDRDVPLVLASFAHLFSPVPS
jgi:hypothetical protein